MQALILAGGFGSRLMPVVNDRPKVMAPVNGVPFLELVIKNLAGAGVDRVVLALGYLSGYVMDYFGNGSALAVDIRYSVEDAPLGTAGAIRHAAKYLQNWFLVVNGDTFMAVPVDALMRFHAENSADMTLVLASNAKASGRGVVATDAKNRIVSFEQLDNGLAKSKGYANAGVYVMEKKVLEVIPRGMKVSLEKETIPKLLRRRFRLLGFPVVQDYLDIGTPDRYKKAQSALPAV